MKILIEAGEVITIRGVQVTLAVATHIETVDGQAVPQAKTPRELMIEEAEGLREWSRDIDAVWQMHGRQYGVGLSPRLNACIDNPEADLDEFRAALDECRNGMREDAAAFNS